MKDVAEGGERSVAVMQNAFAGVFGETQRQRPVRAEQSEVPRIKHERPRGILLLHGFNRGRREIHRRALTEANRVLLRRHGMADARLLRVMTLQQPHGGVEIVRVRFLRQFFDQRICRLPICAGHRMISFRC